MSNKYIQMEKQKQKEKLASKKASKHLNLGLIVYIAIFAYLLFCVFSFSFAEKVNYTVAEMGSIVESETFKGLIIKNEITVNSTMSGYLHFFVPEGEKVKKGSYISIISETEDILDTLPTLTADAFEDEVDDNNYTYIQDRLRNYVLTKDEQNYYYTYSVKNDLNSAISDMSNTVKITDIATISNLLEEDSVYSNLLSTSLEIYESPISGVVSYYFDSFEDINIDNFAISDLYKETTVNEVLSSDTISQGSHIYKIIDNYEWYLAAEINDVCENEINDLEYVSLNFYNQEIIVDAKVHSIINENNKTYAIFNIDRYISSFLTDRFVEFTITYNTSEGIKIPNNAVVQSEFITIPLHALISNGNSKGVNKRVISDEFVGGQSIQFVKANMYYTDDTLAYVTFDSDVGIGDMIEYEENSATVTYELTDTATLDGVYVINKGYPDFRLIETISYNEDYRIVNDNLLYGVMMYDRIMSDVNNSKIIIE